jgi:hypothetical protein
MNDEKIMFQLVCSPVGDRKFINSLGDTCIGLSRTDDFLLPRNIYLYGKYKQFIRKTKMIVFELDISQNLYELYDEELDKEYILPFREEYINDNEYSYWTPDDENFVTDNVSHYLARAISNMAAAKDYTLVAHSQSYPEEAERYINENNARHFVAGKYRCTSGRKVSFKNIIYFECRPEHFEDVFRRTTGSLEHVTGFVLERDKYDELRKLIISDKKNTKWIMKIMDVSALWFESIRHNIGLRIMSKEIGIEQFIKLARLKEINDEMKTIEYEPSDLR